ncbi:hypothetical protein EYF80_062386 [Liparis tanakae]|uniref:Uncharacterized protein n=1 Tax=Liparis tanakae TaxID=230148 RepID=A0A4Z2EG07_9TELE|nr:hypothetical protein EYF80_062386 [Liparis tanakae]
MMSPAEKSVSRRQPNATGGNVSLCFTRCRHKSIPALRNNGVNTLVLARRSQTDSCQECRR